MASERGIAVVSDAIIGSALVGGHDGPTVGIGLGEADVDR